MVPAQGSRAPLPAFTIGLIAGDERPKGSQDQTVPLCPIPRKEANNSHFLEKPPRSRGKRVPSQRHLFCRRETPALTGQTLTTQYKLSYTTRKPFQHAISQFPYIPTFTADINAAENIRRQGLLILTERHRKGSAPARTDRPYRAQIRALGPIFRDSLGFYRPATTNGPRAQKGGITPALFCCNSMRNAHGNQWNQHQLPDRKREKGCHEKYRPTDRINNRPKPNINKTDARNEPCHPSPRKINVPVNSTLTTIPTGNPEAILPVLSWPWLTLLKPVPKARKNVAKADKP